MIYINNNASTIIRTESWLSYIPSTVYVKLDDIVVGEFNNVSTTPTYIVFEITEEQIKALNLENLDYMMKLYFNYSLFKMELVNVRSNSIIDMVDKNTISILKMKEII